MLEIPVYAMITRPTHENAPVIVGATNCTLSHNAKLIIDDQELEEKWQNYQLASTEFTSSTLTENDKNPQDRSTEDA